MSGAAGFGLMGSFIQADAQRKRSNALEQQELRNARAFEQQAQAIELQSEIEEDFFTREATAFEGQVKGSLAKAGVDMSGSALLKVQETNQDIRSELESLRIQKRINKQLALQGALNAKKSAEGIRSVRNLETAGTILGGIGSAVGGTT